MTGRFSINSLTNMFNKSWQFPSISTYTFNQTADLRIAWRPSSISPAARICCTSHRTWLLVPLRRQFVDWDFWFAGLDGVELQSWVAFVEPMMLIILEFRNILWTVVFFDRSLENKTIAFLHSVHADWWRIGKEAFCWEVKSPSSRGQFGSQSDQQTTAQFFWLVWFAWNSPLNSCNQG